MSFTLFFLFLFGKEDTFESMLKSQIQFFFDVTRKRKSNTTGKLLLNHCQSLPQGQKGGLGKYCRNKGTTNKGTAKEVVSESKAVDVITQ